MTASSEPKGSGRFAQAPLPPSGAARVFGDALPATRAYADLLAGPGVERGLIGPREVERLWPRHLLNCAGVAPLLPEGGRVADLGSGAGLPGIVCALLRPDVEMVLIEPLLRRVTFLEECVAALELDSVRVIRDRAENLAGRFRADAVICRAVAPLDRLLDWSVPLLRRGGELLALKGSSVEEEIEAAAGALRRLGIERVEALSVGDDATGTTATVLCARLGTDMGAHDEGGRATVNGRAQELRSGGSQPGSGRRQGRRPTVGRPGTGAKSRNRRGGAEPPSGPPSGT